MADRKDVFEGDKTFLPGIDIDLPLSIVQTRTCEQYIDCYSKAVKEFQDLSFVVENNPFIPPDHEGIFLRGLHAGFHGDFIVASHLLPLQIENSLRYVLEENGVDVSNLMSDGTQPVKVLGAILGVDSFDVILAQIDPAKRSRSVYVYDIPSYVVKFRDGIEENELRIKRKYQPSRVAA